MIDGGDILDLEGLLCALGEAVNGARGYFGASLLALEDCLFGGFGASLPFTIRVVNHCELWKSLDASALARWCDQRVLDGDYLDEVGLEWLRATREQAHRGELSLAERVVDMLRVHGVSVILE